MKANEYLSLSGEVFLLIENVRTGEVLEDYRGKNLIVTLGRETLARLLAGDGANRQIAKVGFGSNGAAPVDGNTALTGSFVKNIEGFSYPSANSVRFSFILAENEAVGLSIRELGLLSSNNLLFARKVRSVIAKTADIRITGAWVINF